MVRRTGLMPALLLVMWILAGAAGCSGADREVETVERYEQSEAEMIRELLGCGLRTAQSIEKECHDAGIGEIVAAEKKEDIYTILELTTEDEKYYVYLTDGFFIEQIRKGSEDGEKIYTAME